MIVGIILGVLIGLVWKYFSPMENRGGYFAVSLIGLGGTLQARVIVEYLELLTPNVFSNILVSVLGSVILVGVYRESLNFNHTQQTRTRILT